MRKARIRQVSSDALSPAQPAVSPLKAVGCAMKVLLRSPTACSQPSRSGGPRGGEYYSAQEIALPLVS